MINRLVTAWARWAGLGKPEEAVADSAADRRVWVRYTCSHGATCQPAHSHAKEPFAAHVSNLSRGGARLVADRCLEPGSLLSLQLPGTDEASRITVLACVLYVNALPDGTWAVGCRFAAELSQEDLEAFGAKRQRAGTSDRRAWVRSPCQVQASCHAIQDVQCEAWTVSVSDLSPSGAALLVDRPVETGEVLSLDLRAVGGESVLTILATVVRVTAEANATWVLGCHFIRRLDDREMQALVDR